MALPEKCRCGVAPRRIEAWEFYRFLIHVSLRNAILITLRLPRPPCGLAMTKLVGFSGERNNLRDEMFEIRCGAYFTRPKAEFYCVVIPRRRPPRDEKKTEGFLLKPSVFNLSYLNSSRSDTATCPGGARLYAGASLHFTCVSKLHAAAGRTSLFYVTSEAALTQLANYPCANSAARRSARLL